MRTFFEEINTTLSWYQNHVGAYDKAKWEQTVEERILTGINHIPTKSTKLAPELIDLDLVRGSSFPKAKAKYGLYTVAKHGLVRLAFIPFYSTWWTSVSSPRVYLLILSLYFLQFINVGLFLTQPPLAQPQNGNANSTEPPAAGNGNGNGSDPLGAVQTTEIIAPILLMVILTVLHSQIIATHASLYDKPAKDSKGASKSTKAKSSSSSSGSSSFTSRLLIRRSSLTGAGQCNGGSGTKRTHAPRPRPPQPHRRRSSATSGGGNSPQRLEGQGPVVATVKRSSVNETQLENALSGGGLRRRRRQQGSHDAKTTEDRRSSEPITNGVDSGLLQLETPSGSGRQGQFTSSLKHSPNSRTSAAAAAAAANASSATASASAGAGAGGGSDRDRSDSGASNHSHSSSLRHFPTVQDPIIKKHLAETLSSFERDEAKTIPPPGPTPTAPGLFVPEPIPGGSFNVNATALHANSNANALSNGALVHVNGGGATALCNGAGAGALLNSCDCDSAFGDGDGQTQQQLLVACSSNAASNSTTPSSSQQQPAQLRQRRRARPPTRTIPEPEEAVEDPARPRQEDDDEEVDTCSSEEDEQGNRHRQRHGDDEEEDDDPHRPASVASAPSEDDDLRSKSEWTAVTTNSEDEDYVAEEGNDNDSDNGNGGDAFETHPFAWEFAGQGHNCATSPSCTSSDRVSCTIWEGADTKKADLTVLDISATIIARVERARENSDYLYLGICTSILLAALPCLWRLNLNLDLGDEFEYDALMLAFANSCGAGWRSRAMIGISALERLCLSFFVFFLLAVAEKTYKQRFLYSKLFSRITSTRKARKSGIPHFRLNKVRNIKTWLSVRSYLQKRGPQRSVNIIVSSTFISVIILIFFLSVELLKDSSRMQYLYNIEVLAWSLFLGVYLLRFMTLGARISLKYRNLSVIITEQLNLYLKMEQKPHKKDELMVANNVLKLAAELLKELDDPFKISSFATNPYLYNITRIVILSAFSGVLSEMLGFKLKLYKIKLK